MHVGVSFSFETMFNSSSVNLHIDVDGGLYTDTICSFVGLEIFTASISTSQFSAISSGMNFLFIMSATLPPALLWSCQYIDTSGVIPILFRVRVSFCPKCVSFSEIILADFIIVLILISFSLLFKFPIFKCRWYFSFCIKSKRHCGISGRVFWHNLSICFSACCETWICFLV